MIEQIVSGASPVSFGTAARVADAAALQGAQAPALGAASTQTPDFASVLARVALDAVDALKSAESKAISGVQGKASVQQVVEAVMSAEQTVQTAIAIRDKVVAAYLELGRMQI